MGKRKELGEEFHPTGEPVQREKYSGEKEHGGDNQLGIVIEEVEVRRKRGYDHRQRAEQDTDENHQDQQKQNVDYRDRIYMHESGNHQHERPADQSPESSPGDLSGYGILCGYGGGYQRVEELLVGDLDEGAV